VFSLPSVRLRRRSLCCYHALVLVRAAEDPGGQKLLRSSRDFSFLHLFLSITDGSVAVLELALIHPSSVVWFSWSVVLVLPMVFVLGFSCCFQEVTEFFKKEPPAAAAVQSLASLFCLLVFGCIRCRRDQRLLGLVLPFLCHYYQPLRGVTLLTILSNK
jgi:hypothetical protein